MSNAKHGGRRAASVLLGAVVLFGLSVVAAPAQSTAAGAAAAGLSPYLRLIPEGREADFGFSSRQEFEMATLGSPYELMTIHPRNLASDEAAGRDILASMDTFRYPVLVKGKIRALLTVARVQGEWKAVDFGAAGLAAAVDRFEENVPGPGEGARKVLLRLYQLNIDFAGFLPSGQRPEDGLFVPLPSALAAIGAGPDAVILYTFPETLKILRARFAALPEALRGDVKKKVIR